MKTIYEYLDYRDFLKDFYESRKKQNYYFSYRFLSDKVGIDPSYLAKVLIKTRHIADKSIGRFGAFCKLNERECEYFETLVHFAKAKTNKQSKLYFDKLLKLKKVIDIQLEEYQYEFYQKWYYSAVRSVLEYFDFNGDYSALAKQLSPEISAKEAKQSIKLLEKLCLIYKNKVGRYVLTDKAITTGDAWRSLAIASFQEETISLAKESISRHPQEIRDISTITMNINKENFHEIKERIKEFRSSLIQYANESTLPDSVYQMNIQLVPLSKIMRPKK